MSDSLQRSIDLTACLGPVRDQGPRGTCLAFGVSAAHEARRCDPTDGPIELSTEALYWLARKAEGTTSGSGLSFASARSVLAGTGQPRETAWPYEMTRDENAKDYQPRRGALDPSECYRAALDEEEAKRDTIRSLLANQRVVAAGLPLWDGFYYAQPDVPLSVPKASEMIGARHVVAFVGYDDDLSAFRLRNSWGSSWAGGGYAWLSYAFVDNHKVEIWYVSAVVAGGASAQGST